MLAGNQPSQGRLFLDVHTIGGKITNFMVQVARLQTYQPEPDRIHRAVSTSRNDKNRRQVRENLCSHSHEEAFEYLLATLETGKSHPRARLSNTVSPESHPPWFADATNYKDEHPMPACNIENPNGPKTTRSRCQPFFYLQAKQRPGLSLPIRCPPALAKAIQCHMPLTQ